MSEEVIENLIEVTWCRILLHNICLKTQLSKPRISIELNAVPHHTKYASKVMENKSCKHVGWKSDPFDLNTLIFLEFTKTRVPVYES